MSDNPSNEMNGPGAGNEASGRRQFLQSMGKWSVAAITAVVAGSWLTSGSKAEAGAWVNRRAGGGGWINGGGGGGGTWINGGGGGGGWINRRGGGGGAWVNRR